MAVTWVEEELSTVDRPGQVASELEVLVWRNDPGILVHHVDLEGDALGPPLAEFGDREGGAEQQGSLGAGTCLGKHLRQAGTKREARVDDLVGKSFDGNLAAFEELVEADLPGVGDALAEVREGH